MALSAVMAFTGATVYTSPESEPVRDAVVLVEGGRIEAAGPRDRITNLADARIIDCRGCTITAGFWNSHVHFFERRWGDATTIPAAELAQQLQEFTRYGFTMVFDLSSPWENTRVIRDRIESGEVAGPHVFSTGEGLVVPGGLPPPAVLRALGLMPTPLPEVRNDDESAATAASLLDKGVDAVKIFASAQTGERMPESVMAAAIREAHARRKLAFAHVNSAQDVMNCVKAGADVIAHTTPTENGWDPALVDTMRAAGVTLTPTLHLWQHLMRHDRISMREKTVETVVAQLRAWHETGGSILFGTDAGAVAADPSPEYALMVRAGMNFRAILRSLTTEPARRFGQGGECGRIEPGMRADLAVVAGDPAKNLAALTEVRHTVRNGNIIYSG